MEIGDKVEIKLRNAGIGDVADALHFYEELIDAMQGAEYPIRWKKGVYPVLEDMRSAALAGDLFLAENGAPELLVPGMLISWMINSHSCAKSFAGIPETKKSELTSYFHIMPLRKS